jgi:hypothetical protein
MPERPGNQISKQEIPKLETIREAYLAELIDTIEFYVLEMGVFSRIKEASQDQEIKNALAGLIMDELTIIDRYREELL